MLNYHFHYFCHYDSYIIDNLNIVIIIILLIINYDDDDLLLIL